MNEINSVCSANASHLQTSKFQTYMKCFFSLNSEQEHSMLPFDDII